MDINPGDKIQLKANGPEGPLNTPGFKVIVRYIENMQAWLYMGVMLCQKKN